ncbi:PqqD family protein [Altererythrobacter sp. CAU 1778]
MIRTPRKPDGQFVDTEMGGETIVLHLQSGEFFSLTDTAAACWRLIDGTHSEAAICAQLGDTHAADTTSIAGDIRIFLDQLEEAGLIAFD